MVERLENKVAILFGAGSVGPGWGNGKATAVLFARNGAHVACVDVNREAAQETVDIIQGEGGAATAFACDVTNSDAIKTVVDEVVGQHSRIDVLHNNVGYATMGGPIEVDEAAWRRTLDLNVTSCFITCKHVLPHMLQRRSGAIVNVSSVAAIRYTGYPYIAYYAAKGGGEQFHHGLGPAVREGWDSRECSDARPDEHAADLPADLRSIQRRRGNGESARRGLSDGTHGNRLGHRQGRAVPGVR